MDRKAFRQLAAHFGHQTTDKKEPVAPFDMGKGLTVLEWRVSEPSEPGKHYQFRTTIVQYHGTKYSTGNPASTHCTAWELGGLRKVRLPVNYDQFVDAYQRAKGEG